VRLGPDDLGTLRHRPPLDRSRPGDCTGRQASGYERAHDVLIEDVWYKNAVVCRLDDGPRWYRVGAIDNTLNRTPF
jgi:hypothetical protein